MPQISLEKKKKYVHFLTETGFAGKRRSGREEKKNNLKLAPVPIHNSHKRLYFCSTSTAFSSSIISDTLEDKHFQTLVEKGN